MSEIVITVLKDGDKVEERFKEISQNIKGTWIILSGLGMLKDVEIGYYDTKNKTYIKDKLEGPFEVLGMSGTVTSFEEVPFHIHVVLGNKEHKAIGGHLFSARVCNTLEIFWVEISTVLKRKYDPKTGLKLIDVEEIEKQIKK